MIDNINIVFSTDDGYAQFLGVALCSIFENKKETTFIDVYIIDGGISKVNKNKLHIIAERYNFKIIFVKIDKTLFSGFYTNKYMSQAAYYRILVPEILPNLHKILYLDCDIIILKDLAELYNTDINNYIFAAVEDYFTEKDRHLELNMPMNAKYFNSGVMLINLDKWRESNMSEKVINFIRENPTKLKLYDQDAMNAVMWNYYLCIPIKYNYVTALLKKQKDDYQNIEKECVVIHYAGNKPWNYLNENPLDHNYFRFLKLTPWKNKKYVDFNTRNIIRKIVRKTLSKLINKDENTIR